MADALYKTVTSSTNNSKITLKVDTQIGVATTTTTTPTYTTQKLKSDYWQFSQLFSHSRQKTGNDKFAENRQGVLTPLSLASDLHTGKVAVSVSSERDNLTFCNFSSKDKYSIRDTQLRKLYSITVPTGPITQTAFLPNITMKTSGEQDSYILTGHQNGVVNLIRTNPESSAILKRFNFAKYLKRLTSSSLSSTSQLSGQQINCVTPITQLEILPTETQSTTSFVSLLDKSLFVYRLLSDSKKPIYRVTVTDILSFTTSQFTRDAVTLNTATSLSLIDLRTPARPMELIPSLHNVRCSTYISEYEIVTTNDQPSTAVQIYDIRKVTTTPSSSSQNNQPQPISTLYVSNKPTYVKSLRYDPKHNMLYVLDTIGNLSSWDISKTAQYRTYKHSWLTRGETSPQFEGLECGDMVVSDVGLLDIEMVRTSAADSQGLSLPSSSSKVGVLAYGLTTFGLHRLVEVPTYVGSCCGTDGDYKITKLREGTYSGFKVDSDPVSEQEYASDGSTLKDLDENWDLPRGNFKELDLSSTTLVL